MKIYARTTDQLCELRKFENKDLWVRAIVDKEHDLYVNIVYVDTNAVVLYTLITEFIKNIPHLDNSMKILLSDRINDYKLDRKNGKYTSAKNYPPSYIRLYPEYGIYSTDELLEMLGVDEQ